jgi:hypothetical protein
LFWIVMPNLHHEGATWHWLDAACLVGVGGVFMALFLHRLGGQALIPVGDPRLRESMAVEHLC